jgi:glucoamylase
MQKKGARWENFEKMHHQRYIKSPPFFYYDSFFYTLLLYFHFYSRKTKMPSFASLTSAASLVMMTLFAGQSTAALFPSGNQTITSWATGQSNISLGSMFTSVNPQGSAPGFLAASLSTSDPDYYYSWTRDSALSFRVLIDQLAGGSNSTIDNYVKDYITYSKNAQSTSTVCNCLGEPKFNPDGSSFTGPWGRYVNQNKYLTFLLTSYFYSMP